MKRAGTRMYVKIGTAGTGGMGLNVPFTHAEERPSRVLLAKVVSPGPSPSSSSSWPGRPKRPP
jgi:hypothetical protein